MKMKTKQVGLQQSQQSRKSKDMEHFFQTMRDFFYFYGIFSKGRDDYLQQEQKQKQKQKQKKKQQKQQKQKLTNVKPKKLTYAQTIQLEKAKISKKVMAPLKPLLKKIQQDEMEQQDELDTTTKEIDIAYSVWLDQTNFLSSQKELEVYNESRKGSNQNITEGIQKSKKIFNLLSNKYKTIFDYLKTKNRISAEEVKVLKDSIEYIDYIYSLLDISNQVAAANKDKKNDLKTKTEQLLESIKNSKTANGNPLYKKLSEELKELLVKDSKKQNLKKQQLDQNLVSQLDQNLFSQQQLDKQQRLDEQQRKVEKKEEFLKRISGNKEAYAIICGILFPKFTKLLNLMNTTSLYDQDISYFTIIKNQKKIKEYPVGDYKVKKLQTDFTIKPRLDYGDEKPVHYNNQEYSLEHSEPKINFHEKEKVWDPSNEGLLDLINKSTGDITINDMKKYKNEKNKNTLMIYTTMITYLLQQVKKKDSSKNFDNFVIFKKEDLEQIKKRIPGVINSNSFEKRRKLLNKFLYSFYVEKRKQQQKTIIRKEKEKQKQLMQKQTQNQQQQTDQQQMQYKALSYYLKSFSDIIITIINFHINSENTLSSKKEDLLFIITPPKNICTNLDIKSDKLNDKKGTQYICGEKSTASSNTLLGKMYQQLSVNNLRRHFQIRLTKRIQTDKLEDKSLYNVQIKGDFKNQIYFYYLPSFVFTSDDNKIVVYRWNEDTEEYQDKNNEESPNILSRALKRRIRFEDNVTHAENFTKEIEISNIPFNIIKKQKQTSFFKEIDFYVQGKNLQSNKDAEKFKEHVDDSKFYKVQTSRIQYSIYTKENQTINQQLNKNFKDLLDLLNEMITQKTRKKYTG